jgi:hypothetical protein
MKLENNLDVAFAEQSMSGKLLEIARWAAVLPAVAICGIVAKGVVSVGNSAWMTGGNLDPENSSIDRLFVVIASYVALGASGVIGGAKVAPRYQVQTAITLTVLLVFMWGGAFALDLSTPGSGWKLTGIISGVVGAVGGAAYIWESSEAA